MIITCPPCYLVVLAGLQLKKVLAPQDVMKMKEDPQYMLLNLILDHSKKTPEDVAITAVVLDTFGCNKEAAMLKCKLNGACVYITNCSYCTGPAFFPFLYNNSPSVSHENTDTNLYCTPRFTHAISCTSDG